MIRRNRSLWEIMAMPMLSTCVVVALAYLSAYGYEMVRCRLGIYCAPDRYFSMWVACAAGALTMMLTSVMAIGINVHFRGDLPMPPAPPQRPLPDAQPGPDIQELSEEEEGLRKAGFELFRRNHHQVEPIARPGNVFIDLGGRMVPIKVTEAQLVALALELQRKPNITYTLVGAGKAFTRSEMDHFRHDLIKKQLATLTRAGECVLSEPARVGIITKAAPLLNQRAARTT